MRRGPRRTYPGRSCTPASHCIPYTGFRLWTIGMVPARRQGFCASTDDVRAMCPHGPYITEGHHHGNVQKPPATARGVDGMAGRLDARHAGARHERADGRIVLVPGHEPGDRLRHTPRPCHGRADPGMDRADAGCHDPRGTARRGQRVLQMGGAHAACPPQSGGPGAAGAPAQTPRQTTRTRAGRGARPVLDGLEDASHGHARRRSGPAPRGDQPGARRRRGRTGRPRRTCSR